MNFKHQFSIPAEALYPKLGCLDISSILKARHLNFLYIWLQGTKIINAQWNHPTNDDRKEQARKDLSDLEWIWIWSLEDQSQNGLSKTLSKPNLKNMPWNGKTLSKPNLKNMPWNGKTLSKPNLKNMPWNGKPFLHKSGNEKLPKINDNNTGIHRVCLPDKNGRLLRELQRK